MNYIVTGATSCIGSAVCQYLLERGERVIAVIWKGSTKEECFLRQFAAYSKTLRVEYANFSDLKSLQYSVNNADVFINFAWAGTSKEQRDSAELQSENVRCAMEAMRMAARLGCKVYIEAGSQAEYGWQSGELTTEESPCEPFSEYGKAKLKTWHEGKELAKQLGIGYVHLRIFSVYGEGELPNTLIATCIKKMSNNEDVELSTCTQLWNYLYSIDAAEMISKLAEHHYNNVPTQEVYNIASLDTRPLRNFIEEIKLCTEYKGNPQYGVFQSERQLSLNPSINKTLTIVGKKGFISFAEGVKKESEYLIEKDDNK